MAAVTWSGEARMKSESDPLYLTDISQVESELRGLLDILERERVTRFLEVGSRFGGSLWRIAQVLPPNSLIVSVDSAKGMGGNHAGAMESLRACIKRLREMGHDAHLIEGDSQLPDQIEAARKFAPFDAVFIDADHEYRGVKQDWKNYGPMARIVAFHDVGWEKPEPYHNSKMVEVPRLWGELKGQYRSEEFIDRSTGGNMGIGVLWMA